MKWIYKIYKQYKKKVFIYKIDEVLIHGHMDEP